MTIVHVTIFDGLIKHIIEAQLPLKHILGILRKITPQKEIILFFFLLFIP